MRKHCTEIVQLLDARLRFSRAPQLFDKLRIGLVEQTTELKGGSHVRGGGKRQFVLPNFGDLFGDS